MRSTIWTAAWTRSSISGHLRARGDLPAARASIRRALVESRRAGDEYSVRHSLALFALVRMDEGAWDQTVCLLSAVDALKRGRTSLWYTPVTLSERQTSVDAARCHLSEEAFVTGWAEGQKMTRVQAVVYALDEDARGRALDHALG